MFRTKAILLSTILCFVVSCAVTPSQESVAGAITNYFSGRNYRVLELRMGTISPLPLDRKTYMGTEGHVVEITRLTLEVLEDNREYRKGEILTFIGAVIMIKEKVDRKGEWIITNMEGIGIP